MIEKMSSCLDSWKAHLLSKGGRLTLIKATLATMPNYLLSLFTIPVLVANCMEAMFRRFLWNDEPDQQKYHLVNWNTCCKPMSFGGLGIRKIQNHNKALLAKWLWRFGSEQDSLWCQVVVARFGEKLVWESREVRRRHGYRIWKSILVGRDDFWKYLKFNLGSSENIKFWKDV